MREEARGDVLFDIDVVANDEIGFYMMPQENDE
jgi:hypothetical protein